MDFSLTDRDGIGDMIPMDLKKPKQQSKPAQSLVQPPGAKKESHFSDFNENIKSINPDILQASAVTSREQAIKALY